MMKSSVTRMLLAGAAFLSALVSTVAAADVSGVWALEFQRNAGSEVYQGDCTVKQEGERLSGSCLSGFESLVPVTGNVKGTAVTFQFRTGIGEGATATFSGQLDKQETLITGTWRFVDQQGNKGEGTFTATKR